MISNISARVAVGLLVGNLAFASTARAQETTLEIPALLPLTGWAASIGQVEQRTLSVVEATTNARGGIKGHPIKFLIQDTESNPTNDVQFISGLIAKKYPVVLGPGVGAECLAIAPITKNGPVSYCFAPFGVPAGGTMYSAGVLAAEHDTLLLRYFKAKGWNRVALITSTDVSGQTFDSDYERAMALPELRGLQTVAHEHFNVADLSVTAQMSRIKSASPDVVIEFTPGVAFTTLLHATQDVGLNVPIAASPTNMTFDQMARAGKMIPKVLLFPAASTVEAGTIGPGPVRDAQTVYFNGYKTMNLRPDFLDSQLWDAPMIILDAYRVLGPNMTAQQLQRYLQKLHGWIGILGTYDFRDGSQRGVGLGALVVAQWDSDKQAFVAVTKPGALSK